MAGATVWVVAGLLSLAGALTYGEFAAMMPRAGGEYVFVREAYGRTWGSCSAGCGFHRQHRRHGCPGRRTGDLSQRAGGGRARRPVGRRAGGVGIAGVQLVAVGAIVIVTVINRAAVTVGGQIASVLATLKVC